MNVEHISATPTNIKVDGNDHFEFSEEQKNFMTPEVRSGGNNQSNSMTMKMQMYQIDMHGSLSVISEEKSMQLQESISAASSHLRQNLLYSATMSSAFNSAHK